MQDARTRGALLIICLVCLLGSGFILLRGHSAQPPPIVFSAPPAAVAPADKPAAGTVPPHPARLYVDVAGAVRRPSLYRLPKNSRVMQAILAAGGPTAAANMDTVNLAEPVTDGEEVFVPERVAAFQSAPVSSEIRPAAAAAKTLAVARSGMTPKAGKGSRGGSSRSPKISVDSGEQIGLNSATAEQLQRLPEVGPSMAAKILLYRQQGGGFAKIDDLSLVPGIGPKKLAKLTPLVSLD